jgi:hypothetical protein
MASRRAKLLHGRAFPAMEAVSAAPAGGSASRSRASNNKGLPAGLSGAGIEGLRLDHQQLSLASITATTTSDAVPVIGSAYPASYQPWEVLTDAPLSAPHMGRVSSSLSVTVILASLFVLDPGLEPVLTMRPGRRPHHLTSGRAHGARTMIPHA